MQGGRQGAPAGLPVAAGRLNGCATVPASQRPRAASHLGSLAALRSSGGRPDLVWSDEQRRGKAPTTDRATHLTAALLHVGCPQQTKGTLLPLPAPYLVSIAGWVGHDACKGGQCGLEGRMCTQWRWAAGAVPDLAAAADPFPAPPWGTTQHHPVQCKACMDHQLAETTHRHPSPSKRGRPGKGRSEGAEESVSTSAGVYRGRQAFLLFHKVSGAERPPFLLIWPPEDMVGSVTWLLQGERAAGGSQAMG